MSPAAAPAAPPAAPSAAPPALRWGARLSFAAPFALAALCAGNGMGFYDAPELAAAGAGLGVTHPPGHPLWVALAALANLVPVGAAPFRIALLSALCLGALGRLAYAAAAALCARVSAGLAGPRMTAAIALAAALCATLGPGTFRQATRVEVYALAGALAAALLALATPPAHARARARGAADRDDGTADTADDAPPAPPHPALRARLAALLLGLSAANHHFIALTAAPVLLWLAVPRLRARGGAAAARALLAWTPLFALGLAPYVLLPLRADAAASLPRVHTALELLETASARVFARNTGAGVPGAPAGRALDVLDWLGDTLTPVGLLFALGGLYLAARTPRARGDAARLAVLALGVCAARAWLGFVRDNPDAAGYLVPAVLALAVLGAGFTAGALRALRTAPAPPAGPSPPARALLAVLLVGGPLTLPGYLAYAGVVASAVDRSSAPAALAAATLGALPPRTVLVAHDPQTIFRLRYAALVEGERPDVVVLPAPLLGYPGMVRALLARDAALTPVMTQYLLRPEQGLAPRLISGLAARRVVALELDPSNIRANTPVLLPRGPVYQVMPEPTTLAAVRGAAAAHFTRMDQLAAQLERDAAARPLVDDVLLWRAYTDALFFAARGARPEARRAVARGLARAPTARELMALQEALAQPGEGPIDIAPFVTREPATAGAAP